jgi:hypothetical protein
MQLIVIAVFFGMLATQVFAQDKKPAGKPGAVVVNAASITATVEAIDYDKRTVALKEAEATSSCSNSART